MRFWIISNFDKSYQDEMKKNYEHGSVTESNTFHQHSCHTGSDERTQGECTRPETTNQSISFQVIWESVRAETVDNHFVHKVEVVDKDF